MANGGTAEQDTGRAVLQLSVAARLRILLGVPVVVVLFGSLLPPLARWLLDLSTGLPMRPAFRFVGAVDRPWEIAVNLAVWSLVAVGVTRARLLEAATVTLTPAEVRVEGPGGTQAVSRADASAVFLDGRRLVILDRESRQLVRDTVAGSATTVAGVFQAYGYPWRDADPYADLYRRWVPDTPDLPAGANAVLAARQAALKKKARREIRDLGQAVETFGYTLREDGTQQYWRPLVPFPS